MPPELQPQATGQPSWIAPVRPIIPDHELVRRIGGGSYGDVWLARTAIGTWRAVKVVFRDRFLDARPYEREFNGIQKFEPLSRGNEAFVDILQIGRNDAEGYFYYVMELADDAGADVGGPSLKSPKPPVSKSPQSPSVETGSRITRPSEVEPDSYIPKTLGKVLLQRGRLPVSECLELGLTLNLGLAHLHKAGLIHRDIKPSNIIFVGGVPKLADIGLVIEVAEARSFVGTEGFIPPEGPNSPQADLYSLGKVLYEAGMGKDRKDFPEPCTQIAEAPDAAELLEFNAIILKACEASREKRYQSAEEMNADLALLQSGGSVRHQRKLAGQLRFVQRAGALVTALAALIALGWWWQAKQTRVVRELAAQKSQLAEENRNRIVRLNVANGIRLLDEGDPGGALLWFADALTRVAKTPEEAVHRMRIQQTLQQTPRLLHAFVPDEPLTAAVWSRDGQLVITGSDDGRVRAWHAVDGKPLWENLPLRAQPILQIAPFRDGRRVFVSELPAVGLLEDLLYRDSTDGLLYPDPTNRLAVLDVSTGQSLLSLPGTNWVLTGMAPNDLWCAVVDKEHVVRLLDATDGRELAQMRGHTNRIVGIQFNPGGDLLASWGEDSTVCLWRLPSGKLATPPWRSEAELGPVCFSPDGRRLAVARSSSKTGVPSRVELWDLDPTPQAGANVQVAGRIGMLAFIPTANAPLYVATEGESAVYDSVTGKRIVSSFASPERSSAYTINPDGKTLAWSKNGGRFALIDLSSGSPLLQARLGDKTLGNIDFSPDKSRLLLFQKDHESMVLIVDLPAALDRRVQHLSTPSGQPGYQPQLSSDRQRLLFRRDGQFSVLDLDNLTDWRVPPPDVPYSEHGTWCFAESGHRFAIYYRQEANAGEGFIESWVEADHGWERVRIKLPSPLYDSMTFTSDGSQILTMSDDRFVRVWRTADGSLERELPLPSRLALPVRFLPHALSLMAPIQRTDRMCLLDLVSGFQTEFSPPGLWAFQAFAFNAGGDRFAPYLQEGVPVEYSFTYVLGTVTGETLSPRLDHGGPLNWVEFSPDGRRLLTTGLTSHVRVLDAETGERLTELTLGTQPLRIAQWSLDGRLIVARSDDQSVRVWDSANGEPVSPILRHAGQVRHAILGRNNRLVTLSQPDLLTAWELTECRLPPDVVSDYAMLLSGRKLNAAGVMLPIKPQELAELCRSLRQRAPELFR